MNNKTYDAMLTYIKLILPLEAIKDCSHQGQCDTEVEYWQEKLKLDLDRENMIKELLEYGAWTETELKEHSNTDLEQKIIWISACNIVEDWHL